MNVPHHGVSTERTELTEPATGHTLTPNDSAEPPMEDLDPQARSYYLVELRYEETPNSFHVGYLSADPVEIRAVLEERYSEANPDTGIGEQVCLWVAQHGVLTYGLDLNPHIRARCADGADRTLAELRELYLDDVYDRHQAAEDFTIDWDAAAPLPPLLAPLAQPGDDEMFLEVPASGPAPGAPLSMDNQEFLNHGWTDLQQ